MYKYPFYFMKKEEFFDNYWVQPFVMTYILDLYFNFKEC